MNSAPVTERDIRFSTATALDAAAGLDDLLVHLITWVRRYVVVTDAQAVAIVLWIAHTHVLGAFDCTPYLQVTSAMKRTGKTRLLEVLEHLVSQPWFTGRTSAAALVRKVDAECPTLLLDESDAAFGGEKEYAETLRGILNSGYRRSGKSTVCVGQGTKIKARDFSTFCPKAVAGIDKLPDTVADRSIEIKLRRKTTAEPCDRWRERDGRDEAAPFREKLSAWAEPAVAVLIDARPALPTSIGDRQADVWESLLAIADLAGGTWPMCARDAAIELSGRVQDQDIRIELLTDIAKILTEYPPQKDVISSAVLIEGLVADEDRPWATWRRGDKPITPRGLARLLDPLDVHVDRYTVGGEKVRGYRRDAFDDAIARYLQVHEALRPNPNETGPKSPKAIWPTDSARTTYELAKTPIDTVCGPQGHIEPGKRDQGALLGTTEPEPTPAQGEDIDGLI